MVVYGLSQSLRMIADKQACSCTIVQSNAAVCNRASEMTVVGAYQGCV